MLLEYLGIVTPARYEMQNWTHQNDQHKTQIETCQNDKKDHNNSVHLA